MDPSAKLPILAFQEVFTRPGSSSSISMGSPAISTESSISGRARILVVEDQEDVRRMLVTALELEGHVVDEAGTAFEGLERLGKERYDLVLTDYAMPGGTGTWMLQEATRLGLMKRTAALIVTAHAEAHDLRGLAVLAKPIDLDSFQDRVRSLLRPPIRRPAEEPVENGRGPNGRCRLEFMF